MKETTDKKSPLVAKEVSKTYDDKVILDDINISINPSDKVAIVGLNGVGKTTLMKILVGEEQPDNGFVDSNDLRIGYLRQNEIIDSSMSLYDYITQDILEVLDALEEYQAMNKNFSKENSFINKYDDLLKFIYENNGFALESKIENFMRDLDLKVDIGTLVGKLSGGELVKANLVRLLIQNPDILVLDEPTNHLDVFTNFWLRKFLTAWKGGLLITSHDRDFLNDVVDKTIELEDGRLFVYGGNYDFYLEQKGLNKDAQEREVIRLEKAVRKAKKQIERENERASHSARKDLNKKPDDNDRVRAHFFKERASKTASKNKDKAKNRMENLRVDLENAKIKVEKKINPMLTVNSESYRGKQLVRIQECKLSYGNQDFILNIDNFNIKFGDRIAVFGRNGSGKTTLVKAIMGDNSVICDGNVKSSDGLKSVALDQHYKIVNKEISVLDNLRFYLPEVGLTNIRRHLANFLFSESDIVNRKAEKLSGGEVARLAMAIVTILPIDLLILDEPTNNLDFHSIQEIEEALKLFGGAILSISHDLSFLQNIGIEESYVISKKKLKHLSSNPSDSEYFQEELISML